MLVSFRPSVPNVNTPSVNRKNPDRTSFQQLLTPAEIKKITNSSGDAIQFATKVAKMKQKGQHLADDVKEQLRNLLDSLDTDVSAYIAQALQ